MNPSKPADADAISASVCCAEERDCEWQPWCRLQATCRRKVEHDRTLQHIAAGLAAIRDKGFQQ